MEREGERERWRETRPVNQPGTTLVNSDEVVGRPGQGDCHCCIQLMETFLEP